MGMNFAQNYLTQFYRAASCTTIEYNKVSYDHPQIKSMTVEEYHAMKNKPVFDVALSISSYEHDGIINIILF